MSNPDPRQAAPANLEHVDLAWNAVLRLLDSKDPSFRN